MSISQSPIAGWRCASALVLALCLVPGFPARAQADDTGPEHTRLVAALRQLDALERTVAHSATTSPLASGERYHFDYPRLLTDLARVRAGIGNYLAPSRAQPRDPAELAGHYRSERSVEPLPASVEGQP